MFNKIRRLWVDCNSSMRALVLTKAQADLLGSIEQKKWITARQLADIELCSIQSATTKLRVLEKKGYLRRRSTTHVTGGVEYIYEVDY